MKNSFWCRLLLSGMLLCFVTVSAVTVLVRSRPETVTAAAVIRRNFRTLVIDPGHGGEDGGAVSLTGAFESGINLAIALRMEQLAAFFGVVPVMTRHSEEIAYPDYATTIRAKKVADQHARVELINSLENAVLISIHQNKYTSSDPSGSQVFYAGTPDSEELANALQALLMEQVSSGNRKGAVKIAESIYLMNAVNCTAVLVECGFVSNPEEARLLEEPGYQTKLAAVIVGGYLGTIS